MPIRDELRADNVDPNDRAAVVAYLARLPIPSDRREGYLRMYCREVSSTPTLREIEAVRAPRYS